MVTFHELQPSHVMEMNSEHRSDHSLLHREGVWRVFYIPLLLAFTSLFLPGCLSERSEGPAEIARRDSLALHIGLMPVADCLPFYLAAETGVYDRLGLDLRIVTYQAQLDTDTALARGHVEVAYSDLARAIMLQQDTTDVRAVVAPQGDLQFITARRGRVRRLPQLRERMVAVARHSITDYWSDRLTDSARMEQSAIFRPQINNVRIRTDMLCNGTMDAAFLPEPYAHESILRGNHLQFTTRSKAPQLAAFVVPERVLRDTLRQQQLRLLLKGYDQVCDQWKDFSPEMLKRWLRTRCLIPDTLSDSITKHLPEPVRLRPVRSDDATAAYIWLQQRDKIKKGYTTDSLIFNIEY